MRIVYLSYGKYKTGGFLHEKHLAESLFHWLEKKKPNEQNKLELIRIPRLFETPLAWLKLQFLPFQYAFKADVLILVSRMAFPALFLAVFLRKRVVLVWHYHDENDNSGRLLKYYFNKYFLFSSWIRPTKLATVVVAPFWSGYFYNILKQSNVFLFPNLLDSNRYKDYQYFPKKKQIHLGQLSWKNDPAVVTIAKEFLKQGFECYFSSTNLNDPDFFRGIPVIKENYEGYLNRMAQASFTLAIPKINEGWNRIAQESFLVKTQVIGYEKGGLGDLLRLANGIIVKDADDLIQKIPDLLSSQISYFPPKELLELDISRFMNFIDPLGNFVFKDKS